MGLWANGAAYSLERDVVLYFGKNITDIWIHLLHTLR